MTRQQFITTILIALACAAIVFGVGSALQAAGSGGLNAQGMWVTINDSLKVRQAVDIGTTLDADGATTLGGALSVAGATNLAGVTAAGAAALNGGITADTNKFTVADTTGNTAVGGTLDVTGLSTLTGGAISAGDITISPLTNGGNAGAKAELSGLVRVKPVVIGTMTNGTTETTSYEDDSPAGEYAPVDSDVTESEDAAIYRIGAKSYKAAFAATAAANDGFKRTITGDDLQNNESIGMWLYPSETVASGDLQILLTDDGGARNLNIGALVANTWNWVEVDISSLDGTTGNSITEFGVTLTTQGAAAHAAFDLYMDGAWKWDATDEEALGTAILQDGVLGAWTVATAAGSPNTQLALTENTDFFVHYESGNDFIVTVTDQSANSGVVWVAY